MSRKQISNQKPWGAFLLLVLTVAGYFFFNFFATEKNGRYQIKVVEITGNKLISREEILDMLRPVRLDSLTMAQTKKIQNTLAENDFIREAMVRISRPSKLVIQITEFEPVAIIVANKNYYLAADGRIYPFRFIEDYEDIPVLNNVKIDDRKVLAQSLNLLNIIREKPLLYQMVSEIYWDHHQPCLVLTENAITVEFPTSGWNEKVFLLDRFIQRNFKVIMKKNYKKINLHFNDKIICS